MKQAGQDQHFMAHALRLAERGLWTTEPNPRVGCVLVKEGQIVGEGWHVKAGEPHAEVLALKAAGAQAEGADCYVTLEPCSHHGRTPPCTDALIKAGVQRVVAAMTDPNPHVSGNGLKKLQKAGIGTHSGVLREAAEQLNPGFLKRMRKDMPYLWAKLAMSLDGRSAMATGESQWITGDAARRDAHALRARASAILTGAGTVLADDPQLNVRAEQLPTPYPQGQAIRQPLRVVVDPHLSVPPSAQILSAPGKTLIITASTQDSAYESLEQAGAEVWYMPGKQPGRVDLKALLQRLAKEREINEIHLEAGANLNGAMLQAGLIDEFVFYVAPSLLGNEARGVFNLPALARLADKISLQIQDIRAVGADWRISAKPG